jgi:hypothetical protein
MCQDDPTAFIHGTTVVLVAIGSEPAAWSATIAALVGNFDATVVVPAAKSPTVAGVVTKVVGAASVAVPVICARHNSPGRWTPAVETFRSLWERECWGGIHGGKTDGTKRKELS